MEHEQFRKKVYMQTLSSTLINHKSGLTPQWTSDSLLNFNSAYEFASYNIQDELMQILPRDQGENEVIAAKFRSQLNENKCEMYYVFKEKENYYLVHQPDERNKPILIYQNTQQKREKIVHKFLDFLLNDKQQMKSSKQLINRTQQMIEEISDNRTHEKNEDLSDFLQEMHDIKQLLILPECGFAVMLVEMKRKNGIMLVHLDRSAKQKKKDFCCPIVGVNLNRCEPDLTEEESHTSKIIYIFPQTILEIHRTSDITRFIILTERYLIMAKLNYDLMELCIQHKMDISQRLRGKVVSVGVTNIGEQDFIIALLETKPSKPISGKLMKETKQKRLLKLLTIIDKKIVKVKQNKHASKAPKYSFQEKTLKFLDEQSNDKPGIIRFNDNVVQSRYQIADNDDFLNTDFNQNVIMTVFNSMLSEQSRQQQRAINTKEQTVKNFFTNEGQDDESSVKTNSQHKTIQEIGGFVVNKNLVIVWEKSEAVIHICKLVSKKQQEDNYNNERQELNRTREKDQMMREKEMKDMYAQLMGLPLPQKNEAKVYFEPKLDYFTSIQLELTYPKIQSISVSPNNYNLLLISASGNQNKESLMFNIFQLELFLQLSNPDPNMFVKPIKNIHKKKQIEQINNSLVKDTALFLTGNLIHSLENELLEGALSFDIHPYHHFMAVSFGFTTKIYALQGNDRLTSLFTLNGQGMKSVKYSPMGNHLCILFSKSIKIIDAYSFCSRFSIQQKNSNFVRCSFSSNGLQFYTISENHAVNVYNTFDYTKIDSIKPSPHMVHQIEYKPIFVKSFLKQSHYCLVLEDGGIYVKYKSDAIVMAHQQVYHYEDEEKIISVEIDQKNGVLFTGCLSGKLRTHIWPMKQQHNFENFTEIRTSFSAITCLSLSSISAILYVGNQNGNISKVKYYIDRDKGLQTPKEHTSLMSDKNIRFMNLGSQNKIQKIYKFMLLNSSSLTEQLPQKLRLQYKLSEVINKLNEQMKKLKVAIHNELQEKQKISTERFDINLYHHLNQMITTKLYTQLKDEEEVNNKELSIIKEKYAKQVKEILHDQNLLLNQKSLNISENHAQRTSLTDKQTKELQQQQKKYADLLKKQTNIVVGVQKIKNEQQDPLFYLPNDNIDNDKAQKKDLIRQLQRENKRHFDLRKACAYKETAIKGMQAKKIKEETLEFKIKLEATEMNNKLQYNRNIIKELKDKIEEAEQKVHKVQAQASIIKTSAQFKRVANIEEMNDACSYKLWMKEKIQTEISNLVAYYRLLEEILDDKSSEIVDLVSVKINKLEQVTQLNQEVSSRKEKLHEKKLQLMDTHTALKRISPMREFRALKTAKNSSRNSPSRETKDHFRAANTSRDLSSRKLSKVNKDVTLYNNIMQKQMNFLKTNVKIHQRKIKKFGKQNGELLTEYQKLKYQNKKLKEAELFNLQSIDKVQLSLKKHQIGKQETLLLKPSIQLAKTSFQKYLEIKQSKQAHSLKYKTASSTPTHLKTCSTGSFL